MSKDTRKNSLALAVLLLFVLAPIYAAAQVAWVEDFESALKQAAKENKFVILDLSASW